MGNMGRFGKYGEYKRLGRLGRKAGTGSAEKAIDSRERRNTGFPKRLPMSQTRLLPGRERDAPFIGQLSRKVFGIYGPYGRLVSQWFATGATVTLVAFVERVPAGFSMMGGAFQVDDTVHAVELLALAVEPEYQRGGVGTLLMQAVERVSLQCGMEKIFLHTATENTPAQRLFEGNGFHVHRVIKDFYPEGQDAFHMGRALGVPKERPEEPVF
ncbi:GNAT family N-acetyltransferase [Thermodesulfobacteriota bacterium]